jgi:ABC-type uncharacterized transport system substrate-binding protein
LTGVVHQLKGLGPKLLELLREIVPGVGSVAVFINPRFATNRVWAADLQQAAQAIGQRLQIVNASNEAEIAEAFETIRRIRAVRLCLWRKNRFLPISTSRSSG